MQINLELESILKSMMCDAEEARESYGQHDYLRGVSHGRAEALEQYSDVLREIIEELEGRS